MPIEQPWPANPAQYSKRTCQGLVNSLGASNTKEMLTQKLPHKDMSFGQVLASVGWALWGELDVQEILQAHWKQNRGPYSVCCIAAIAEKPSAPNEWIRTHSAWRIAKQINTPRTICCLKTSISIAIQGCQCFDTACRASSNE